MLKKLGGRIWMAWALLYMVPITLIFLIAMTFHSLLDKKPGAVRRILRFGWWLNASILTPVLISFKTFGKENIEKDGTYVFVSNHVSIMDIPANCKAIGFNGFKFLSKKELTKLPIYGSFINKYAVIVDRKSPEGRKESYQNMIKCISEENASVLLYPEGTRNRTTAPLKSFYDGAFKLAIETQAPLVVCTLVGADKLNHVNAGFYLTPGKINCYIEEPISTVGMSIENDLEPLKQRVASIMIENLKKETI